MRPMDVARPGRLVPAMTLALAIGALGVAGCQRSPQPTATNATSTNTPEPPVGLLTRTPACSNSSPR